MKKEFTEGYHSVFFQPGDAPVFCYRSGLTVYEEVFSAGTLNTAGWNASGYPLNVLTNCSTRLNPDVFPEPNSFSLEIDGEYCDRRLEYVSFESKEEGNVTHAVVTLLCRRKNAEIRVHTILDGTPIITRYIEVENKSENLLAVNRLGIIGGGIEQTQLLLERGLDPSEVYSLGYMDSDLWATEGDFSWHKLTPDIHSVSGNFRRNRFRYPMFMLRNNILGNILTAQLAWSTGFKFTFDLNAHREKGDTSLSYCMELDAFHPLNVIKPGETMKSPEVHIGMIFGDTDDAVNAMNAHMRRSVFTVPGTASACLVGSGMGPEHDMSVETTKQYIDQMAAAGAEVFIIDAGWYCPPDKENEWWLRAGNWNYDPDRYPNGIEEVREYAHSKGLKFGMWMEPARIAGEQIAKEHPGWFPEYIKGNHLSSGFLDFSNPEAVNWVEQQVIHVISDYKLDLFRVDYNTDSSDLFHISDESGRTECRAYRHVMGVYGMYRRLKERFPHVIFENCAGGGGRCDAGMVSNFNHTWVSDNQLAPRSLLITNGMTLAIPPEKVDRLVAGMGCHKRASLDFHMRNAMFGHLTLNVFGPRMAEMNPDVFEFVRHSTDLYKSFIRPYLADALIYHHTPDNQEVMKQGWLAIETAAPDASRAALGIFSVTECGVTQARVYPRGLSAEKTYRVTFDNTRTTATVSGFELINNGVNVRITGSLSSELVTFEEV